MPIRVVHLEDDPLDAELVRETLTADGIPCTITLASSREAFLAAIETRPDIVLADYQMQNRPAGLELLERMVNRAPGGQKRAGALLTADATEKMVEEADKLGFPVLRKPVRPGALRALIAALVDRLARASQVSSSTGAAN